MTAAYRLHLLAQQESKVFHTKDFAVLWGIKNRNTLYTLLKRYNKNKILHRIYKGLYSLVHPEKIDPILLGIKALHEFSYVSTETVLAEKGILSQIVHNITLISSKSLKFEICKYRYISRKLQDKYLFNSRGIVEKNGVRVATLERAVADYLYFNPKAVLDGKRMVNWRKVKSIQKSLGYHLTPHLYASS